MWLREVGMGWSGEGEGSDVWWFVGGVDQREGVGPVLNDGIE